MSFMPLMVADTYRLVAVPHEVCLRVIDDSGQQDRLLSWAVSSLAVRHGIVGRAIASAFVSFLNVVARTHAEPARRFTLNVSACRQVMHQFLKGMDAQTKTRNGSQWVTPGKGRHAETSRMLSAVCAITGVLAGGTFGGLDPSRVDPSHSRLAAVPRSKRRADTDRWLRMRKDPGIAPRLEDPRVYDRLMEGLRRTKADEAVMLSHALARNAGNRYCQGAAITLYDLLVESPQPCQIPAINKGSAGERILMLVVPRSLWDRLLGHIDGDRRRRGGLGLAEMRRMAADPRRRAKLMEMPLFTLRGEEGLKYDRLYRQTRAAAEAMDLFFNDELHRATGLKRYVTIHMLRHEYVHSRMDAIEAMDRRTWPVERARLAAYMGWGDPEGMLEWYSAHHTRKNALASAIEYTRRIDDFETGLDLGRRLTKLDPPPMSPFRPVAVSRMSETFAGL